MLDKNFITSSPFAHLTKISQSCEPINFKFRTQKGAAKVISVPNLKKIWYTLEELWIIIHAIIHNFAHAYRVKCFKEYAENCSIVGIHIRGVPFGGFKEIEITTKKIWCKNQQCVTSCNQVKHHIFQANCLSQWVRNHYISALINVERPCNGLVETALQIQSYAAKANYV